MLQVVVDVVKLVHKYFSICARPQYWETSMGHKLPINNANTSNTSMCPKTFKNMFWLLFTYIYLLIIDMLFQY